VERPYSALTGKLYLTLTYEVTGDSPAFNHKTNANNNCDDGTGAGLSLLIRRYGADVNNDRWFSQPSVQKLTLGTITYKVPLRLDAWTPVFPPGAQVLFDSALASVSTVGFVFGGGCFAAHGAALTSGSARFTVKEITAQ